MDGIVALLTEDAWLTMPPLPLEYQGRELAARFFILAFRRRRRYRLVATRANGQPAFGVYMRDPHAPVLHANGLIVLTLAGDRISMITRFDPSVLPASDCPGRCRDSGSGRPPEKDDGDGQGEHGDHPADPSSRSTIPGCSRGSGSRRGCPPGNGPGAVRRVTTIRSA